MAVTCVTYSPDFAQWKCHVLPGRTTTLPGGCALRSSGSNRVAQADVKDARNHRVNSILRVLMRHKFHASGHLDPDQIRSGLSRVSNKHGQSRRRRKRRERFPIDIFRENRFENVFAWLVDSHHRGSQYLASLGRIWRIQLLWKMSADRLSRDTFSQTAPARSASALGLSERRFGAAGEAPIESAPPTASRNRCHRNQQSPDAYAIYDARAAAAGVAFCFTAAISVFAAGPEEAGFCPVISKPSLTT